MARVYTVLKAVPTLGFQEVRVPLVRMAANLFRVLLPTVLKVPPA